MKKLKSPIFTFTFSFLFLLLSLFPLLSSAQNQFLSTGPICRPEVLTSVTDFPNSKAQCPWCPDRGATKLRLSWDLPTEQTNPLCVVTCRRPDGQTCQGASRRGNDGLATSTSDTNLMNLGKKGELTLAGDIREGNEYTVSCCEKCPPGARPGECHLFCKNEPDSVVSFPAQVVGECRQTCERPFEDIIDDLENFRPTTITERNFRDWSNFGGDDLAILGGSGEGTDLQDAIVERQCLPRPVVPDPFFSELGDETTASYVIRVLRFFTKQERAAQLTLEMYYPPEFDYFGRHAVIFLSMSGPDDDELYTIRYLDPNYPDEIGILYCSRSENPSFKYGGLKCSNFKFGADKVVVFIVSFKRSSEAEIRARSGLYPPVRERTARWLEKPENRPGFDNFGAPQKPDGNCKGWTDFVLSAAYYGDFTGIDYHPADGNYVGEACGQNGAPLKKKKTSFLDNPSLWLANLAQIWTKFTGRLTN